MHKDRQIYMHACMHIRMPARIGVEAPKHNDAPGLSHALESGDEWPRLICVAEGVQDDDLAQLSADHREQHGIIFEGRAVGGNSYRLQQFRPLGRRASCTHESSEHRAEISRFVLLASFLRIIITILVLLLAILFHCFWQSGPVCLSKPLSTCLFFFAVAQL